MKLLWDHRGGEIAYDAGIFRVRKDRYDFRGVPAAHPFHVIEANSWVNVVPVTPAGEIVLVNQFRHGIQADSLEVPGGVIDPEDPDPEAAGVRELLEETGYQGGKPRSLGTVTSNPAIFTNSTYTFWIPDVQSVAEPRPDAHEALETLVLPVAEVRKRLENGEIQHALSVVALLRYLIATDT